jgi:hypothetical protein
MEWTGDPSLRSGRQAKSFCTALGLKNLSSKQHDVGQAPVSISLPVIPSAVRNLNDSEERVTVIASAARPST